MYSCVIGRENSYYCCYSIQNLFINFQDLYRILLEADSERMLEDVDMVKVEKLLLTSKAEAQTENRLK